MIIKKLAVPFINNKLLQEVQHCYIATSAISEAGFDFIRSRIPTKTRMDIVTSLDAPTSPEVLKRIWRNYQGRITLNIYTRNVLNANVYIFDLPFRKSVAFVGSGACTSGGIKDHEELFWKVTDLKDIENLKSWFTGYFEFAEPLTETLINEYADIYPLLNQREIISREEKQQFISLTTAGFNWDQIRFRNQFFKKEDYLTLSSAKAQLATSEVASGRDALREKLLDLLESLEKGFSALGLSVRSDHPVSSTDPEDHVDYKVQSMWMSFSRRAKGISASDAVGADAGMHLRIIVRQRELGLLLLAGAPRRGQRDREYIKDRMTDPEYVKGFLQLLLALPEAYRIEVAGERRSASNFQNDDMLSEFVRRDDWRYYSFTIGRSYAPGDKEISTENISDTLTGEAKRLLLLYDYLKAPV